ncbi:U5 small nuclear ribonucleoprotein 40 kDa protein-like [Eupeodes corollae]|uniref:U5 small nuclear ribonucleoprotein 40 kDa protein-like n=1 Tax=Eupeodes corollae TaxID=290404 RepID=UPI0024917A8F|nr:U5 small nuclear ribonucleoprotein 40 kDa protein-like [Eupeodes corollae]
MAAKRLPSVPGFIQTHKRSKLEGIGRTVIAGILRTSSLPSPIIRLEDHQGAINSCKFHPLGELVMSAGYDKQIYIRCVYGDTGGVMTMTGHRGTITETQFSPDGSTVYSSSLDDSVALWDTATGARLKFLEGHRSEVNTVQSSRTSNHTICSGSNDGTIRLWDTREAHAVQMFNSGYQVLASCFNDRGDHIMSGGVDNCIKIWDLRKNEIVSILIGHEDMISGMALSPSGNYLLSNSLDNTLRIWNMRPFMHLDRCVDSFIANQSMTEPNLLRCAWSRDSKCIAAGSSDQHVYIWDVMSRQKVCELEGHETSVIDIDFHPIEPILVSGSSYENLYLHELQS